VAGDVVGAVGANAHHVHAAGVDRAEQGRFEGRGAVDLGDGDAMDAGDLREAVVRSVTDGGVRVVRVRTDRATNVTRHRAAWAAVANAR